MLLSPTSFGRCITLLVFATALSNSARAQQAPSAGSQLQQIPALPSQQTRAPDVKVSTDAPQAATSSDATKVVVKSLQFAGATVIDVSELMRVSGFVARTPYSLADLRAMATRLTAHYRKLGYLVAQTYLPAQDITDGNVKFTVLEGQYGQVTLRNSSPLADSVAHSLLDGLQSAGPVSADALERRLLLLSDLPGVNVKSSMAPASVRGATDLTVEITPGQPFAGSIEADNHGNRYTGANRVGGSINFNELAGLGDVASLRVLTSGEGLVYGRASYQLQAGKARFGAAYTTLNYLLGEEFSSTQSSGTARVGSVFVNYPLIRARNRNLGVQWVLDNKDFSDRLGPSFPGGSVDKNAQLSSVNVNADLVDAAGTGISTLLLSWTRGRINLQNEIFLANDSSSAQSHGEYDKVAFGVTRLQELMKGTDIYGSVTGQRASKNLDASEKFSLGGASGVRAYPAGEATGDEGTLLTLEARTRIPEFSNRLPGQLQWTAFLDAGTVRVNRLPWESKSQNRRELSGAGLGLNWTGPGNLGVKAFCAFKLGDEVALSAPDMPMRFWLQTTKTF